MAAFLTELVRAMTTLELGGVGSSSPAGWCSSLCPAPPPFCFASGVGLLCWRCRHPISPRCQMGCALLFWRLHGFAPPLTLLLPTVGALGLVGRPFAFGAGVGGECCSELQPPPISMAPPTGGARALLRRQLSGLCLPKALLC
jgi:hypothetical protein